MTDEKQERKQSGFFDTAQEVAKTGAGLVSGIARQAAQKARQGLGYDDGFKAGYAKGLNDGNADYAKGYQAGLAQGRAEADKARAEIGEFADRLISQAHALKESLAEERED